jgi:thiazole synthase
MGLCLSLNGEAVEFPSPLTVEQLLEHLALDPAKVAVERNLAIVPRSTYGAVALASGDKLEIEILGEPASKAVTVVAPV